jgi:hypothetical protein
MPLTVAEAGFVGQILAPGVRTGETTEITAITGILAGDKETRGPGTGALTGAVVRRASRQQHQRRSGNDCPSAVNPAHASPPFAFAEV